MSLQPFRQVVGAIFGARAFDLSTPRETGPATNGNRRPHLLPTWESASIAAAKAASISGLAMSRGSVEQAMSTPELPPSSRPLRLGWNDVLYLHDAIVELAHLVSYPHDAVF